MIPLASTFTSTSWGPGAGRGSSSMRNRPPISCRRAAFMVDMLVFSEGPGAAVAAHGPGWQEKGGGVRAALKPFRARRQRPAACRVCSEKLLALAGKLVFQLAVSISETVAWLRWKSMIALAVVRTSPSAMLE